jgi:methylaspartate mutase sigma subunit
MSEAGLAVRDGADPRLPARKVVLSGVASDSHTWNLVYLQLLIEELGYEVVNLGPCVPDELLVDECVRHAPDIVVVSSVNGHGRQDGLRMIGKLRGRAELAAVPVVIGGKLSIDDDRGDALVDELMTAGFDAVFLDGRAAAADFRRFVGALPPGGRELPESAESVA